jgi:hypothetical protein
MDTDTQITEMVTLLLMPVTIIAKRFVMDIIMGIGMQFQTTGTPDSNKANQVKWVCMETTLMWI